MADLKIILTSGQIKRLRLAMRFKYGMAEKETIEITDSETGEVTGTKTVNTELKDTQLVESDMKNYLKVLVQSYEKKVEVAKIKLNSF